jgi:hypothetical protein
MRNRRTLSVLAATAAAALLAAAPAMANDPDPRTYNRCSSGCVTLTTNGPVACDGGANTCITYNVTGTSTPDHLGIFLRAEASLLGASGSYTVTAPCGRGDSALGLGSNLLCHERLIDFDNHLAKAVTFTLKVAGKRTPIVTTVTSRKGNTQCASPIMGIGFEEPPPPTTCVNSCGNFSPKQSVRKTETFHFEGCVMEFHYDADGSIPTEGGFTVYPDPDAPPPAASCTGSTGLISDILVQSTGITPGNNTGTFGDGWLSSGGDSCSTRMVGGTYYTVCR